MPPLDELRKLSHHPGDGQELRRFWYSHYKEFLKEPEAASIGKLVDKFGQLDAALCDRKALDRQISDLFKELEAVGAVFTDPVTVKRLQLAHDRLECIRRLAEIEPLPDGADVKDRLWIERWDKGLLEGCNDVDASTRNRYKQAVQRSSDWAALEAAIKKGDPVEVAARTENTDLLDYPPYLACEEAIRKLTERGKQFQRICDRLQSGDRDPFAEPDARECLRSSRQLFEEAQLTDRIQSPDNTWVIPSIRLTPSTVPVLVDPDTQNLRVRWGWLPTQEISYCLLGIDEHRSLHLPRDAQNTRKILLEHHRANDGGCIVLPPPGAMGVHVTIWPILKLEWIELAGEPLRFPRIDLSRDDPAPQDSWWIRVVRWLKMRFGQ